MKIKKITSRFYEVPFKTPLISSKQQFSLRKGIHLVAETDSGMFGVGEVAPLEGFSKESLREAQQELKTIFPFLERLNTPEKLEEFYELLDLIKKQFSLSPSVFFGLETLFADLSSKNASLNLSSWFGKQTSSIPINGVLSGPIKNILLQLERNVEKNFSVYKLKIGSIPIKEEVARIREVSNLLSDDVLLRLDANQNYSFQDASELCGAITELNIDYLEEPLENVSSTELKELRDRYKVPIALDESLDDSFNRDILLQSNCFDVAILKPTYLGGILKCLDISKQAHELGIKSVVTSTLETGVGLSACLHTAAILGTSVLPCGLDTLGLLSKTLIEEELEIRDGSMLIPQAPGLGVTLVEDEKDSFSRRHLA